MEKRGKKNRVYSKNLKEPKVAYKQKSNFRKVCFEKQSLHLNLPDLWKEKIRQKLFFTEFFYLEIYAFNKLYYWSIRRFFSWPWDSVPLIDRCLQHLKTSLWTQNRPAIYNIKLLQMRCEKLMKFLTISVRPSRDENALETLVFSEVVLLLYM